MSSFLLWPDLSFVGCSPRPHLSNIQRSVSDSGVVSRDKLMSIPAFAWSHDRFCQGQDWVISLQAWQLMLRWTFNAKHVFKDTSLNSRLRRSESGFPGGGAERRPRRSFLRPLFAVCTSCWSDCSASGAVVGLAAAEDSHAACAAPDHPRLVFWSWMWACLARSMPTGKDQGLKSSVPDTNLSLSESAPCVSGRFRFCPGGT